MAYEIERAAFGEFWDKWMNDEQFRGTRRFGQAFCDHFKTYKMNPTETDKIVMDRIYESYYPDALALIFQLFELK